MDPEPLHLQMIQSVIGRLASQSTVIKGWSITLTAALLGLAATIDRAVLVIVAAYAIATFAVLDAYYLGLERAYRAHYRAAADAAQPMWSLDVPKLGFRSVVHALCSPAIWLLYGTSLVTVLIVGLLLALQS